MKREMNEQGIAVIVVVAIMVALVVVTTALLATVTRASAAAKVYSQKDLARLATLSGRAVAINAVTNVMSTGTAAQIAAKTIYDLHTTASTGAPDNLCTPTCDPLDFSNSTVGLTAHGLAPYARVAVIGRTYGAECPVRPPLAYTTSANKASLIVTTAAITAATNYITSDAEARKSWQVPNDGTNNLPYYQFINLSGYDKDFSASFADPTNFGAAFHLSRFAVCIQDLGGCLCVDENPNNDASSNNKFTGAALENIVKGMGLTTITATSFVDAANTTYVPQYSFADIANTLGVHDDGYLGARLQLTPWGKEDEGTNHVPLCINIYTASEKIIDGVIRGFINNTGSAAALPAPTISVPKITAGPDTKIGTADDVTPAATTYPLSTLAEADIDTVVASIITNRKTGKNISEITGAIMTDLGYVPPAPIGDGSGNGVPAVVPDKVKAACLLTYALFGVLYNADLNEDSLINTVDTGYITSAITTANVNKYGRFVGLLSDTVPGSGTGVTEDTRVDKGIAATTASVLGPGPYFRIFVRGALVNLGKGELTATADYECVYFYDKATPANSKIVYQRWYENE